MIKKFFISLIIFCPIISYSYSPTITVFASSVTDNPCITTAAYELGQYLGQQNFGLITGGGTLGLMKEISDGYVSQADSLQTFWNVILKSYSFEYHPAICKENIIIVPSVYERIHYCFTTADIIIVLPGGFGTLQELVNCLMLTRSTTPKPIILCNISHFWDSLLEQFQLIIKNNPIAKKITETFFIAHSIAECREIIERNLLNEKQVCYNGQVI